MTRGRKPTPTVLKIMNGNPGKRPLPKNEPKPAAEIPDCPAHLDAAARNEWDRITVELGKTGLITRLDMAALAAYCQTYSIWVDAETKLKRTGKGRVILAPSGYPVLNPWHTIATQAAKDLKAFAAEFGFTPSARARINLDPGEKEVDPIAAFTDKRKA